MTLIFRLEVKKGADKEYVKTDLFRLAYNIGIPCFANLNGVEFRAFPGKNVSEHKTKKQSTKQRN